MRQVANRTVVLFLCTIPLLAQCPVEIESVNPADVRSWAHVSRSLDNTKAPLPPDFSIKVRNSSDKDIRGMKILAAYYDSTEDLHIIPVTWNSSVIVKAGTEKVIKWDNFEHAKSAYIGWIVIPSKVLFEDGSKWEYGAATHDCFGEYWHSKKHPRLTGPPDELLKKLGSE